jgi:hypothetical protein
MSMIAIRIAALAAVLALTTPSQADTKTFLIDSSDGYGIDRCLAAGEACGRAAATALCRANAFARVVDYGRMEPNEITGTLPGGLPLKVCQGPSCPVKVAITCTR